MESVSQRSRGTVRWVLSGVLVAALLALVAAPNESRSESTIPANQASPQLMARAETTTTRPATTTTAYAATTTTTTTPPTTTTSVLATTSTTSPTVQEASPAVAPTSDGLDWDALARCESGGNWHINTGNGYYGGLQFDLQTWRSVGGTGYPHEHSREVQIHHAEILYSQRGAQPWPHCGKYL